jgi:negative regulator of sigma E activity
MPSISKILHSYIDVMKDMVIHSINMNQALELVNEVRNELNYDLTFFYENKLGKELISKRKLEDKEREIVLKLEDVQFNIDKVKGSIKMIGESQALGNSIKEFGKKKK